MPDVVSNDELNALAAEYVLGTLDYEERKGAAALLDIDPTFRGIVRIWERRFGELHLMVEAVEPDPQLWLRIKPKMPGVEQVSLAIPSHADEPAAAAAVAALAAEPAPEPVQAPMPASQISARAGRTPAAAERRTTRRPMQPSTPAPVGGCSNAAKRRHRRQAAETKFAERLPEKLAEKLADAGLPKPPSKKMSLSKTSLTKRTTKPAEAHARRRRSRAQARGAGGAVAGLERPERRPRPENGLHTHAPDLVARGLCAAGADEHARHAGGGGGADSHGRSRLDSGNPGDGPDRGRARRVDQRLAVLPRAPAGAIARQYAAQPDHQGAASGPRGTASGPRGTASGPQGTASAPKAAARPKLAPFDE